MGLFSSLIGLFGSARGELRRALALVEADKRPQAFKKLSRAARAGLAEAEYHIARSYLEGSGVPPSQMEGLRWLERAAAQDFVHAQSLLAAFYVQGAPVAGPDAAPGTSVGKLGNTVAASLFSQAGEATAPDFTKAAKWARKAADAGSAESQALLAYILISGPEELRDVPEAERLYAKSAAAKCAQGQLGYGMCLLRAAKAPEDFVRAAAEIRPAAEAGLGTAQYLMGTMIAQGQAGLYSASPPPKDKAAEVTKTDEDPMAASTEWYRLAAEQGVRTAQFRYGLALMNGSGVEKDEVIAESWLRRAAMQGDPDAAATVGQLYARNGALPANMAEAALWLRRAAETGHVAAARALGAMHMTGNGVVKDPLEAANWFRLSAQAGDVQSRYDLANLVLQGKASPADSADTASWFKAEGEKGDMVSVFNYGVCLAEGLGVQKDEFEAARWLRRAADHVVNAQYWYGRLLLEGRGVPENAEEARAWISRAAESGVTDAQVALAEMFVNGRGGPRDHQGALSLFRRAAKADHVGAMYALGAMFGGGHEVMWDRAAAETWFQAAAA